MFEFGQPVWFVLLVIPFFLAVRAFSGGHRDRDQAYSSAAAGLRLSPTWRTRTAKLPTVAQWLAIIIAIVALAGPRTGRQSTVINSEGIAIELVVDRSSSMRALDFQIDDRPVNRLTAIKQVASRFVSGGEEDDSLPGRPTDLIGLITFAGYAEPLSPPTLDHRFITDTLERLAIVSREDEDGTAIGDAVALAAERLTSLRDDDDIESRVAILLTDGENTAGKIEPLRAAALARTLDVKVYTIGVGTKGLAPVPVRRSQTGRQLVQYADLPIDEETLRAIAEQTGGQYFRATDTDSLAEIYAAIDSLEKTRVRSETLVDYRDWALQSVVLAGIRWPPLLAVALILLMLAVFAQATLYRRLD